MTRTRPRGWRTMPVLLAALGAALVLAPSALAQPQVQYAIGQPVCHPTAAKHPTFCQCSTGQD